MIFVLIASISSLTSHSQTIRGQEFQKMANAALPIEELYDFRDVMLKEFNRSNRDPKERATPNEVEIAPYGWLLIYADGSGQVLHQAILELQAHLETSMQVQITPTAKISLQGWLEENRAVVVGVRDQMPGCGHHYHCTPLRVPIPGLILRPAG